MGPGAKVAAWAGAEGPLPWSVSPVIGPKNAEAKVVTYLHQEHEVSTPRHSPTTVFLDTNHLSVAGFSELLAVSKCAPHSTALSYLRASYKSPSHCPSPNVAACIGLTQYCRQKSPHTLRYSSKLCRSSKKAERIRSRHIAQLRRTRRSKGSDHRHLRTPYGASTIRDSS